MKATHQIWWCLVVLACYVGLVRGEVESSCYGAGSIAAAVILTFISTAVLLGLLYIWWKKYKAKKGVLLVEEMDGLPRELCFPALADDLANSIRNSFSGFDVTRAVLQPFLYRSQALVTDISRTHVKIGKYHLFDLLGLRYRPSNELALSTPPMCLLLRYNGWTRDDNF
ncbi:unnamed protein product [Acanthoscelides obtectus]|uniref:Uncharacterized protein n=1 Tax=Acanthoscelides obtectus TaxID=200917 RepID=A0A9P0LIJ7_ACAOB|nr:unnamed protein product [Acanthoscelides obtectus]CAK1619999.1 hypothetical protein AOBTE_LOCUS124 [Acanthoscelides obtectus]